MQSGVTTCSTRQGGELPFTEVGKISEAGVFFGGKNRLLVWSSHFLPFLSWLPLISAQRDSDVQTLSEQRSQHFFSLKKLAVDHASTLVSFAV